MIPYEIDPSLHDNKPEPRELEDGFSPPHPDATQPAPTDVPAEAVLTDKSPY
jgi:hypothetical protein